MVILSKDFTRVNIKVTKDVYDFYKSKSERTGVPMSTLMYLELDKAMQIEKKEG